MSLIVLNKINLANYTSWLIGGDAEYFCTPKDETELQEAFIFSKNNNLEITILGSGSNVLISDLGIQGLVICLKYFNQVISRVETKNGQNKILIEADAGSAKSELLKIFLKNKLSPALFLAGIPGQIGGGVVMNAGVTEDFFPREFMEIVDEIDILNLNGKIQTYKKSELKISYRHTTGWQPGVIFKVRMSWPIDVDETVLAKVKTANLLRLSKQPLDWPSCGSVFKNPVGFKAAQLIDQCGLKGFRIGDAQVSEKHANFIINLGKATATDTWNVIQHVRSTVLSVKNVSLTTEVVRLGHW